MEASKVIRADNPGIIPGNLNLLARPRRPADWKLYTVEPGWAGPGQELLFSPLIRQLVRNAVRPGLTRSDTM